MKLKCKRCGYVWDFSGKAKWYASCPRCRTTVRIKDIDDLNEKKEV